MTGLKPREFVWVIAGRLAVCERIGGYGFQHRRVRREEEITGLRNEAKITTIVSLLPGNQNVNSYFLVKATQGLLNRANEWAPAGGTGTAFSLTDDPESIARILDGILNEVLSVSTTFVAPSVPANVYTRSQTLNEVFIAIFEL